jgi:hypothetical protein
VSFSKFSTGTAKLASKTQKKFKKVSVLNLLPQLRVQKQIKKLFKKPPRSFQCHILALEIKKIKVGSGYCIQYKLKNITP